MKTSANYLRSFSIVAVTIICSTFSPPVYADGPTILLPAPAGPGLFDRPFSALSTDQQMRVLIHGLRTAPLHPAVWGENTIDRTDSRNIVPMKRYYFRPSERDDFELEEIVVNFAFSKVKERGLKKSPSQYTPLLDIEFAGTYEREEGAEIPGVDRTNVARISASPFLPSGIFFRSRIRYLSLSPAAIPVLETGQDFSLRLHTSSQKTTVILGTNPFAEVAGNFRKGLVSLRTDWSPLSISSLEVRGSVLENGARKPIIQSGLTGMK